MVPHKTSANKKYSVIHFSTNHNSYTNDRYEEMWGNAYMLLYLIYVIIPNTRTTRAWDKTN